MKMDKIFLMDDWKETLRRQEVKLCNLREALSVHFCHKTSVFIESTAHIAISKTDVRQNLDKFW